MKNIKSSFRLWLFLSIIGIAKMHAAEIPTAIEVFDLLLQSNRALHLKKAQLNDDAVAQLAKKLKDNKTIKTVDLSSNDFGDVGLIGLMNILPSTSITSLYLKGNKITDEGICSLCFSAYINDENSQLRCIDLRDNPLTDVSRIRLSSFARQKPKLTIYCSWDLQSYIFKRVFNIDHLSSPKLVDCSQKKNATKIALFSIIQSRYISDDECVKLIKSLVEQGADINGQNEEGMTPLHVALRTWREFIVIKTLCDLGADLTKRCNKGKTAIDQASEIVDDSDLANLNMLLEFAKTRENGTK